MDETGGKPERVRVFHTVRSLLFVPGDRPDRFAKAENAGADAVVFDLEDAVAPSAKAAARTHVLAHLHKSAPEAVLRLIRVNPVASREGLRDLLALAESDVRPDAVILPKVESAEEIPIALGPCGAPAPLVIALIESARGLAAVESIAAAAGVSALGLGAADLAADLGVAMDAPPLDHARSRLLVAAVMHQRASFDVPCLAISDAEQNRRDAEASRTYGFTGKFAIHPGQIASIHAAFQPSAAALDQARAVLAASAAADGGIATLNGQMIDAPVVEAARSVIARAVTSQPARQASP